MTIGTTISRLLDDDALDEALEAAKAHVKSTPSDHVGRNLYIDLLILAGEYERADNQCSLAATFSPDESMGYSLLRGQLRSMAAREAWFTSGAVPDVPGGPSPLDRLAMKAGIALRNGDVEEAAEAVGQLEEQRGEVPITWNGKAALDIRDLDDRIPHALEVLTSGGRYLWIDYRRIETLTIAAMTRPRDLAFRQAELSLIDGAVASVLIPAVYWTEKKDPARQLGRETIWSDEHSSFVTGAGQRCLLVGDDMLAFHELTRLETAGSETERQIARG